jgi:predicted small lipoprotein YifL
MQAVRRLALAVLTAATLAACGGGGGGGTPAATAVVPQGTALTVNQQSGTAIAQALAGQAITFNVPIPVLGTTNPTTVTFDSPTTFTIRETGFPAVTGTLSFGSCIFTVGPSSPYGAGHPLAAGSVVTVNPCEVRFTGSVAADGVPRSSTVQVAFGGAGSVVSAEPLPITVQVTPQGNVSVVTPSGTVIALPQVITTRVVTGATS